MLLQSPQYTTTILRLFYVMLIRYNVQLPYKLHTYTELNYGITGITCIISLFSQFCCGQCLKRSLHIGASASH